MKGTRALVAHTCNPRYPSGGRDQEDHGLKPSPSKYFRRSYLEKTDHKKKGLVELFKW
jgi:hypothetical protein